MGEVLNALSRITGFQEYYVKLSVCPIMLELAESFYDNAPEGVAGEILSMSESLLSTRTRYAHVKTARAVALIHTAAVFTAPLLEHAGTRRILTEIVQENSLLATIGLVREAAALIPDSDSHANLVKMLNRACVGTSTIAYSERFVELAVGVIVSACKIKPGMWVSIPTVMDIFVTKIPTTPQQLSRPNLRST